MIKVSVIVPVYNGEKHLRQCLDSICNQTLKEIEIICVDDGSTDSSPEILREYQNRDSRFRLYSQKNKYAGAARNLGKTHATGEYLAFWDCDDYFERKALELLYQQAKKTDADIVVCGANKWYEDRQQLTPNPRSYLRTERIPSEVFNRTSNEQYILNFTNAVPWNKLFRRSFIEGIGLDFQAVRNGNDIYFTQCAIALAERISYVDKPLVNYRLNQGTSLVDTLAKSPLTPFRAWIAVGETLYAMDALPEQSFSNKAVDSTVYLLRNIKNAQAFAETFDFLKNGGTKQLYIQQRDPDFYYTPWHYDFVNHLLNDSLEDFKQFMLNLTYMQLMDMEFTLLKTRNSKTFKVGDTIMRIPREIKALFTKH